MATTKIIFVVLPQVHLLDLAGADQVFFEAIDHGADLELVYCSVSDAISTSTAMPFGKLPLFNRIRATKNDYVFVPGASLSFLLSAAMKKQKELFQWMRQAHAQGATICSICTGAFVLGQAGLLDGKKCTTHWKRTAELQALYPAAMVAENILFTEEERVFTSAGVTAGIDLALHILSRLQDDHFSYKVARELVIYARRQGHESQQTVFMHYRNHIHGGIHSVQDYIQEHIGEKINLPQLAEIACMSTRNLTRLFKKETGISINEYVNLIRKDRIKTLLKDPDTTRAAMARHCGLTSERQVARLIKTI